MKNKKTILIVIVAILVCAIAVLIYSVSSRVWGLLQSDAQSDVRATSSADIRTAYSKNKDAVIERPKRGEEIQNGFVVRGKASGAWLFEASTEIRLETIDGTLISSQIAQVVEGENWMTTDLVPWTARIVFDPTNAALNAFVDMDTMPAKLVFIKSNPSGEPERDEKLEQVILLNLRAQVVEPL